MRLRFFFKSSFRSFLAMRFDKFLTHKTFAFLEMLSFYSKNPQTVLSVVFNRLFKTFMIVSVDFLNDTFMRFGIVCCSIFLFVSDKFHPYKCSLLFLTLRLMYKSLFSFVFHFPSKQTIIFIKSNNQQKLQLT